MVGMKNVGVSKMVNKELRKNNNLWLCFVIC